MVKRFDSVFADGTVDDLRDIPRGKRRDANKARRIAALLASARALIEESGSTEFTMQELARRSSLSLASIYNLVGTKAAVLYRLLDQSLDTLDRDCKAIATVSDDERLHAMALLAVRNFTQADTLHRPLLRFLLGVYQPQDRPRFMARALEFWREAVQFALPQPAGCSPDDYGADLAIGLHLAFTGALDLWVHDEIAGIEVERLMYRQAQLLTLGIAQLAAKSSPLHGPGDTTCRLD